VVTLQGPEDVEETVYVVCQHVWTPNALANGCVNYGVEYSCIQLIVTVVINIQLGGSMH
jgi:hypothetical protein